MPSDRYSRGQFPVGVAFSARMETSELKDRGRTGLLPKKRGMANDHKPSQSLDSVGGFSVFSF